MKRFFKYNFSAFFAVLTVFLVLTGCGGESSAAPASSGSIYVGSTVNMLGEDSPIDEVYNKGANTIEFAEDGTGTFTLDGNAIPITYVIDGTDITITTEGMDSIGTIENGVLSFDYFGMGIKMVFLLQ